MSSTAPDVSLSSSLAMHLFHLVCGLAWHVWEDMVGIVVDAELRQLSESEVPAKSDTSHPSRAGPYVVPFDGKETAVTNAISQVLAQYTKNVTVLSYSVGAPIAYGPSAAPSSSAVSSSSAGTRRSMLTADSRCMLVRTSICDLGDCALP